MLKEYSYLEVPTVKKFNQDLTFISAIMGPVGSGKSSGCVIKLFERALAQLPGPDGICKSRWAVVRNSYPMLRDTTIPTVHEWLLHLGDWKKTAYDLVVDKIKNKDGYPVEATFHFRALDKPDDIRNLLSLELTGAWFNEVREIPKKIVDVMRTRVGRYPKKDLKHGFLGATWSGIIMDTNPCDTDHWFYKLFEEQQPKYCIKCRDKQGGIILVSQDNGQCPRCGKRESLPLCILYKQPGGQSPEAENLPNLPRGYYALAAAGMDKGFIQVYVDGQYGYVHDGKPVYGLFDDVKHISTEPLIAAPQYPIIVGFDNTGRDQAAVICQYLPNGQMRVLHEFIVTDTSTKTLVRDIVKPFLIATYPGANLILTGDPAGVKKSDSDDRISFEEINEAFGIMATPAHSNALSARLGAVDALMKKYLGKDQYGLLVSPSCRMIIKGFRGEYKMRRLQVIGQERYTDKPEKNLVSHGHDALQYACMAVEEAQTLLRDATNPREEVGSRLMSSYGWGAFV